MSAVDLQMLGWSWQVDSSRWHWRTRWPTYLTCPLRWAPFSPLSGALTCLFVALSCRSTTKLLAPWTQVLIFLARGGKCSSSGMKLTISLWVCTRGPPIPSLSRPAQPRVLGPQSPLGLQPKFQVSLSLSFFIVSFNFYLYVFVFHSKYVPCWELMYVCTLKGKRRKGCPPLAVASFSDREKRQSQLSLCGIGTIRIMQSLVGYYCNLVKKPIEELPKVWKIH